MNLKIQEQTSVFNFEDYKKLVLKDYYTIFLSRETSILGRREVLSGKGKFGIFGAVSYTHLTLPTKCSE